jgi:hypothetical protein
LCVCVCVCVCSAIEGKENRSLYVKCIVSVTCKFASSNHKSVVKTFIGYNMVNHNIVVLWLNLVLWLLSSRLISMTDLNIQNCCIQSDLVILFNESVHCICVISHFDNLWKQYTFVFRFIVLYKTQKCQQYTAIELFHYSKFMWPTWHYMLTIINVMLNY